MSGFYVSRTNILEYAVSLSEQFSLQATNQALLEMIVIGRIPLTDFQISYDLIVSFTVLVVWTYMAYLLTKVAVKKLNKIDFFNYIDQISL